jgi:acetolactate synthase-1/2/3 large subunit
MAAVAEVANLVVGRLRDAGVACVFGMPGGGGNLDLIEAAGRAGLPFVLTSTETAGALAAMAQAEITGRPGACLTTLGPGAASVVNGIACAYLDRAPVLVFTDSYPAASGGVFAHQRLDHRALLAPITKWSATLTARTIADTLDRALDAAMAPPPGPVHLDWPGDLATSAGAELARSDPSGLATTGVGVELARPLARGESNVAGNDDETLFDSLISRSRKPLLLVGLGARRRADAAAIRALCEVRGVPAMVTYKAKGVVPDHHIWFAGVFTNAAIEQKLIEESDLMLGVGLDPVELIPRAWTRAQPIVYCGRWPVAHDHVPFAAQLVTDVPAAVRRVETVLPTSAWSADHVRHAVEEQRRSVCVSAGGLTAQRVVQIAAARLAPRARVTVDAGAHMFPATMLWPVGEPTEMLISNGLSTMGFALPAAIGAALVDRDRAVVALTGDGGLLMCAAELLTAARERLRVIVIVFSDASLSLIEVKQQQKQYPAAGVGLGAVSWPALAGSLGVTACCAANEEQLERSLEQALAGGGPSLIEARIDRSNYGRTLRAVRG